MELIVPGIEPGSPAPSTGAENPHNLPFQIGLQLITERFHLGLFNDLDSPGAAAQDNMMVGVSDFHRIHIGNRCQKHFGAVLLAPTATASAMASVFPVAE